MKQIPTFQMINENFVSDIYRLNQMYKDQYQFNINELIDQISDKKMINENFDLVLKFLKEKQNEKEMPDKVKILLNGLFLYTQNYVLLNNTFAKHLDKDGNFQLNDVIVDLFHTRYKDLKPICEKKEYIEKTKDLVKNLDLALAAKDAREIGIIEETINKSFPEIVNELVNEKLLTHEDDIIFSNFSIGSGIIQNYLNRLFAFINSNINIDDNKNKETEPKIINKETDNKKVLTKSIDDFYRQNAKEKSKSNPKTKNKN